MSRLDLIVEVGAEEIPAPYMAPAMATLQERLKEKMEAARLTFDRIKTWITPRRMAFAVYGLLDKQPDTVQEITGPPARAAFDANGNPTKAATGFARGQNVDVARLFTLETPKGPYVAVRKEFPGRPTADVLTELLPPLILGLPFPKTMRWGKGELVFVRPIHWLLAVLGGKVLPMSLGEIKAGNQSFGHRFLHPGPVTITAPDEYEARLAVAQVITGHAQREELVKKEIDRLVAEAGPGVRFLPDDDLVIEVADLVESPVGILGRFDESYLKLPQDILITAMRSHQRYFALVDDSGRMRPFFIAINNTRARDMNVVRRGHERVLRARLDDARFYFEEDRKVRLEDMRAKLETVVFHALLGTSWEKVQRFRRVAEFLADRLDPAVKATLLRAADLCKCDLVSGVVGEFPTLQGVMGREYALADGEPEAVAQAIFEHYLPVRAGGELPQSSAGALLSLADKMDTIVGCFSVGLVPTGTADPFALRRQALGVIHIILDRGYRVKLGELVDQALEGLGPWTKRPAAEVRAEVLEFFRLRLKNLLTGRGASADGAEAVLSLHFEDLVPAAARVQALEEIKARPDFSDLAAAFKRVVNIIRKFGAHDDFHPERLELDQEQTLFQAVKALEDQADRHLAADDFSGLLAGIVALKPRVDRFFDDVLVDDPDPGKKALRLGLLTRVARLFDRVADFSKIST